MIAANALVRKEPTVVSRRMDEAYIKVVASGPISSVLQIVTDKPFILCCPSAEIRRFLKRAIGIKAFRSAITTLAGLRRHT